MMKRNGTCYQVELHQFLCSSYCAVFLFTYLKIHGIMFQFQHIVTVVDKAYGDEDILMGCPGGFHLGVFHSISDQIQMTNAARAHLFLKPSDNEENVLQKATAKTTESQEMQRPLADDQHRSECAVKPELWDRQFSTLQPLPHVDKKSESQTVQDSPRLNKSHKPDTTMPDKQKVKTTSKEKSSSEVLVRKLSADNHRSKPGVKSNRPQSTVQTESDVKLDVPRREQQQKSRPTGDVQQQLAVDKSTAESSGVKLKKSSLSKHKKKVQNHSSTQSQLSSMKSADHEVKSVVVRPADEAKSDNSCQNGSGSKSDDKVARKVTHSFDEV